MVSADAPPRHSGGPPRPRPSVSTRPAPR
jgi:hypothetical protein